MRAYFCVLLTCSFSFLLAQAPVGLSTMELALSDMRASTGFSIALEGEDITARSTVPFRVNAFCQMPAANTPAKIQIWSYQNSQLDRLIVGDGANFYRYDRVHNQYSITPYKTLPELTQLLQTGGNGAVTHFTRLLRDIQSTATWQPWVRLARISNPTPTQLLLQAGDPVHSELIVKFAEPLVADHPQMREIRSGEVRSGLTTRWRMEVFPGHIPNSVDFRFAPPAGAKPVAVQSSVKSGG